MKLSAVVLLSVNLVAASQAAAHASEQNTAAFLQESLNSRALPSQQMKRNKKLVALSPVIDGGTKIRPFVPGRYLPSQAELERQKSEKAYALMLPKSDSSGLLTGQVSDYSAVQAQDEEAIARRYIQKAVRTAVSKATSVVKFAKAAPRTVPGATAQAVLPGQIAQLPGNAGVMPRVPEPQDMEILPVAAHQSKVTNSLPLFPQAPILSKFDQDQLDRAVAANMPEACYAQGSNGESRAMGQGNPALSGTGPPPFPLSLLPAGKRQISAGQGVVNAPVTSQARFGSWHGGSSGLGQASFHTYLANKMNGPLAVSRVNKAKPGRTTGRQATTYVPKYVTRKAVAPSLAKIHYQPAQKMQPSVATYPAYRRYSG
ncbi:MAG: hypothetical protein K2W82_06590 [Candidatus Obscuribacterales bacterium]|nr:hypothetical protein [Candidatus Obscuribacterales bacterium]